MVTIQFTNPTTQKTEQIKVYGLTNHPDIQSFYADLEYDAAHPITNADDLNTTIEKRCINLSNLGYIVPRNCQETYGYETFEVLCPKIDCEDNVSLARIASTAYEYFIKHNYSVSFKQTCVHVSLEGTISLDHPLPVDITAADLLDVINKHAVTIVGVWHYAEPHRNLSVKTELPAGSIMFK